MFAKQWVLMGSTFGFFSVALGAFGAHALRDILSERAFQIYQTGVQYQMFHALALLALGLWSLYFPALNTQWVGYAFTLGILLFSGSLYALALTNLKFLGAIAPFGGVAFLMGWIAFAILAYKA